uniref:AlkB homolog 1, histone H2A dioxygenase n=1 Tax=Petromyzon marinus TaxID=7757 RepID=S4RGI1_PETMA
LTTATARVPAVAVPAVMVEPGEEAMRQLFKFYRRRCPAPDLGGVLDLRESHRASVRAWMLPQVYRTRLDASALDGEAQRVGLQPASQWRAYGLNGYPGFIFIVNPFLPSGQRFWVRQCLKLYPRKPNVCNLDAHDPQRDDVWASGISSPRAGKSPREPRSLLEKLRWVTLGYHYNWDTKVG